MPRLALTAAVTLAAALAVAGIVLLVAGGGHGPGPDAAPPALAWAAPPRLVAPPGLPRDRVLFGQVRNPGRRALRLRAGDLRVLDRAGRALPATARFLQAYAPGPRGTAVTLAPGRAVPLTVAWRGARARVV